ncbi:MAG: M4 family metallopeptidase [Syntrophothermus sp.]
MLNHRILSRVSSMFAILAILFLNIRQPAPVQAQGSDGLKRLVNGASHRVSFIVPEAGRSLPGSKALGQSMRPQDPGMALARQYGQVFGLKNPERELAETKRKQDGNGKMMVRYQQKYDGVPVMAGELIVNTDQDGDLYSMNGEISQGLSLSTQPAIDAEQARQTALSGLAKWYQKNPADFKASTPELWIFDESLLKTSSRPAELVWRMEITPKDSALPIRELVLVGAQRGNISLHFNQIDTAWHSGGGNTVRTSSSKELANTPAGSSSSALLAFTPQVLTYTANGGSALPGTFLCTQAQPNCTNGIDAHADAAQRYALGTFNLYNTQHNRNSLDNNGMAIISTVHYCDPAECPFDNAFWDGVQIVYGDASGWPFGDDVVAHELTHGVTQYESNLFYYYQSGAINESFSDVWGEYYDQTDGFGSDSSGVKWYIGEDVTNLGSLRNMANPPSFSDPDRISSFYYYTGSDDNGGVHFNSGVNNKAVYLMVDGDSFNGKTISPLGWTKTLAIYYEAQTNLLVSGADYSDLYYALQKACSNLIGQKGITAGDCNEVKDALDAVEMNAQPEPNFNTEAPLCTQKTPAVIFADDLENGTGNWTFQNGSQPRWQIDSVIGPYAQSGNHSLYAADSPEEITDARAQLASFVVPANAYLHFAQAYGFESGYDQSTFYTFDGGVVEYTTNGGSTWLDAGPLMDYNGYNGTVYAGAGNPLSGRSAFVDHSHGYISTRLNLAPLAGSTVSFRWRMGLDEAVADQGWWVDNIKMYVCTTFADVPTTYWSWKYIEGLYNASVTGGCNTSPMMYCPTKTVNRAQMAVFLLRAKHGSAYSPPAAVGLFSDVPKTDFFAPWIEELSNEGITGGCGGGKYCPGNSVTRAQMAIFLLRAEHGSTYAPPSATGMFLDVPQADFTAPFIEQLANEQITGGCGGGNYCPAKAVTRDQMAVFLVRTFGIPTP